MLKHAWYVSEIGGSSRISQFVPGESLTEMIPQIDSNQFIW